MKSRWKKLPRDELRLGGADEECDLAFDGDEAGAAFRDPFGGRGRQFLAVPADRVEAHPRQSIVDDMQAWSVEVEFGAAK
jgi:hypothetical protein